LNKPDRVREDKNAGDDFRAAAALLCNMLLPEFGGRGYFFKGTNPLEDKISSRLKKDRGLHKLVGRREKEGVN